MLCQDRDAAAVLVEEGEGVSVQLLEGPIRDGEWSACALPDLETIPVTLSSQSSKVQIVDADASGRVPAARPGLALRDRVSIRVDNPPGLGLQTGLDDRSPLGAQGLEADLIHLDRAYPGILGGRGAGQSHAGCGRDEELAKVHL
jgi:hypothetical protein